MNSDVDELALAVLKKPLSDCSLDELQQIAGQYPYFGPVQLLLAKKLAEPDPYDPDNHSRYDEQVQKASLYFQNRVWLQHLLRNKNGSNISHSPNEQSKPENRHIELPLQPQGMPVKQIPEEPSTVADENKVEQLSPGEEDPGPVSENIEQGFINEPREEPTGTVEFPPPTEPINTTIGMPPLKDEQTAGSLLFEPYHTVDYFASQGIKFREEEKPKDRLGAQLKSFTEWLKTLKQMPASEIISKVDSTAEKKVEQMAEFSIAERHVITEAMAEVWKKQGNRAKAEEVYHKLSLLDPSKSSYFAAKIEELKKTN